MSTPARSGAQSREEEGIAPTLQSPHTQRKEFTVSSVTSEPQPELPDLVVDVLPQSPPRRVAAHGRCSDDTCNCSTIPEKLDQMKAQIEARIDGLEGRLLDNIGGLFAELNEQIQRGLQNTPG